LESLEPIELKLELSRYQAVLDILKKLVAGEVSYRVTLAISKYKEEKFGKSFIDSN